MSFFARFAPLNFPRYDACFLLHRLPLYKGCVARFCAVCGSGVRCICESDLCSWCLTEDTSMQRARAARPISDTTKGVLTVDLTRCTDLPSSKGGCNSYVQVPPRPCLPPLSPTVAAWSPNPTFNSHMQALVLQNAPAIASAAWISIQLTHRRPICARVESKGNHTPDMPVLA